MNSGSLSARLTRCCSRAVAFAETVAQDAGYAVRSLLRMPAFTIAALLALAVGVGSTTAVFSIVDRILFRSLPYPDDERLVSFGMMAPLDTAEFVLGADWPDWQAAGLPLESLTTFTPGDGVCDLADDRPVSVQCAAVEWTFLKTFGIAPLLGRDFTPEDDRPNAPKVAIISHALWQNRFGGSSAVAGRLVTLNGVATAIAGVLPSDFEMPNLARADILVPQQLPFVAHPNSGRPLRAFARLKPNVTIAQAEAAMRPVFERLLRWVPEGFRSEVTLRVRSLRNRQVEDVQLASWTLFCAVFAVLLIACANVSNLLLARAAVRQREFAVRAAIGASRRRLVRQALTESLVLGCGGGMLGFGLALVFVSLMIRLAPAGIPRLEQAAMDLRSLLFTLAVSVGSALIFGLAPAWRAPAAANLVHRSNVGARGLRRYLLVSIQIAVSLVLLTGAGLLVRTLRNLEGVSLGMRPENVIAAPIVLRQQRYASPRRQRLLWEALETRLSAAPGLGEFAVSDSVPLGGPVTDITGQLGTRSTLYAGIEVEGRPRVPQGTGGLVAWRHVTPGYFRILGIPMVRGRAFIEQDRGSSEPVVIVSESLAQRLFPAEDALGKRFRAGPQGDVRTIVGIAANVKNNPALAGPDDPEYYIPRGDDDGQATPRAALLVRTSLKFNDAVSAIRSEVAAVDPLLPLSPYLLETRVGELSARPRFHAALLGIFAFSGLMLAAIGLYGVISFLVAQRTAEIGVRLALGATSTNILALVLAGAMRWTIAGVAFGTAGAFAVTRLLSALLFQVEAGDPWTFGAAITVLLAVALAAAAGPARRAARIDPLAALREE